jgi:glucose-6-phosphate isomerase
MVDQNAEDGARPTGGPPAGVALEMGDGELSTAVLRTLTELTEAEVAERLAAADPTIWGPEAEVEAAQRLGWLALPETSRALLPELDILRSAVRDAGMDHDVLAGMGGSSLAPEVITRTAGVDLTVLDTTDPGQIKRAIDDRLRRTVVVVASKSGSTIETDSHRRFYEEALRQAGVSQNDLPPHFVVVTDPGTSLEEYARDAGYVVIAADPTVGGRYSALSAFGLVPSALAGAEVAEVLDTAAELQPYLAKPQDNPGLLLGAVLGAAAQLGKDKVVIADAGSGLAGFGDWAEQLIAESTGKHGRGLLPVVVEAPDAPGWADAGDDALLVLLGRAEGRSPAPPEEFLPGDVSAAGQPGFPAGPAGMPMPDPSLAVAATAPAEPRRPPHLRVYGSLGAQFLLWEYATAVAGRVIGINPFDQPNVAESKENTAAILSEAGDGPLPEGEPVYEDDTVAVYAPGNWLAALSTQDGERSSEASDGPGPAESRGLRPLIEALLDAIPDRGYLAVMAYLDRIGDAAAARLRPALAERSGGRQVTFGWGPRFLHSTGQFHKGGPQVGTFLQITGAVTDDLPVPGRPFSFGKLQLAQALGDLRALAGRGRPVLRVHLKDRQAGLSTLFEAVGDDSP